MTNGIKTVRSWWQYLDDFRERPFPGRRACCAGHKGILGIEIQSCLIKLSVARRR